MKLKCVRHLIAGQLKNADTIFLGQAVCEPCLREILAEIEKKRKEEEARGKTERSKQNP